MRTVIQVLTVVGLTAGLAYSQEQSDSVPSVMNELSAYQGTKPAAVKPVEKPVTAPAAAPAPAAAAAEPAAAKPAVPNALREQYAAGRSHRATEETALKKVSQEWGGGIILRSYPATEQFVKSMKLGDASQVTDIKPQLTQAKVEFPAGSSARYVPEFRKLFVENTAANLEKLENVLAAFKVAETKAAMEQVKIETRFVEFNEGALQELGFNWSNPNDINRGDWSVQAGQDLFSGALRGAEEPYAVPFSKTGSLGLGEEGSRVAMGDRLDNGTANRIEDTFNSNASGVKFSGKVGGEDIGLTLSALDQSSGVDVLSAPSVTTLSGQPAVITVGERHFYPETYEAGESQGTVVHVKYEDFKEKILGVEMTVTPTIKSDEIQMKINPKINELLGWQQFELAPQDSSYTYYQYRVGSQFNHDPVIAQLPLFNRREVKTEVTVASGATVGMGGLIGEKTEAFSDRVPVLGSIPLVGRLFRSEGNRTVKRNLMIFVTATKVAPNGRMISERSFEK